MEIGETIPRRNNGEYGPIPDFHHEILDVSADARDGDLCVICLEAKKNSLFYPCGHMCVCTPCGEKFMA